MTPEQVEEHDRAFELAAQLVKPEIIIQGHQPLPTPTTSVRSTLEQALQLFAHVLKLNPKNWSAMWLVGKVNQRLGDQSTAFTWFVRAHELNPSQVDVAREASLCAMSLGRSDEAISYARSALASQPSNDGLGANLALAFLLAGRLDEAKVGINKVMARGAADSVSQTVGSIIDHFIAVGQKPPSTTASLEDYWKKRRH